MNVSDPVTTNVVDVYELSPMQQGMLFHTVYAATDGDADRVYFEQRHCLISGDFDPIAFQQAWQNAVDRHDIFRTGFYWQEAEKPLQVVYDQAQLGWEQLDWQAATTHTEALDRFLQADRDRGFDLKAPPLMRCALIQLAPQQWQFVWSHHHLLMDGWCNGILLRQVLADYAALRQAKPLPAIVAPAYRDYILWLQQQDQSAAQSYWQHQMQDLECQTYLRDRLGELRTSHAPKPPILGALNSTLTPPELGAGGRLARDFASVPLINQLGLTLSSELTTQLKQFAQQQRLTLGSIVQGAWALLLSNYSDSSDVVFGLTVAGRPPELTNLDQTIGLFINTLPVRVQLDPQQSLTDWLQQIQIAQAHRSSYSYSSLTDIQTWAGMPRNTSLFDTLLVIENYPLTMAELLTIVDTQLHQQLTISEPQSTAASNYAFVFTVIPSQTIKLEIEYQSTRYTNQYIQAILRDFAQLLEQFAASPMSVLSQFPHRSNAQLASIQKFSIAPLLDDLARSPLELFEQQVRQAPGKLALIDPQQEYTYDQLNAQVNQLAHYLLDCGIQPDDRVAICLARSPQQIITLLAVLKAGAAYVPIDVTLPIERIEYLLTDSQPKILLTDRHSQARLPQLDIATIVYPEGVTATANWNPVIAASPANLAYLIYTSGSTGQPKGVMIERQALTDFTTAAIATYELTPHDRVLQFSSLSFDAAIEEIFCTLSVGATLVLRPDAILVADQFWQYCCKQQITVLDLPTAYWQQLIQASKPSQLPSSLRSIIVGGEAVSSTSIATWQSWNLPATQIWNSYGPTEATVVVTVGRLDQLKPNQPLPIGKPLPGRQIYILDRWLQPTPIGNVGEIYIGGSGLARGYWQRPELTATKFIETAWGRLYATGDRGYWRPDGQIVYQGRRDHQVKLRGFRVELDEISVAIQSQPQVDAAITVLDSTVDSTPRLLAYYVGTAAPDVIRQKLVATLPHYMVPSSIVCLPEFPLTPLGKIDRTALPRSERMTKIGLPRNAIEIALVDCWQEVLNQSPIGIDDNFFELGGHSLLAMRLITQMQPLLASEISLKQLFDHPTIAAIAALQLTPEKLPATAALIPAVDRTAPLPLSFAQQRLWILQQLDPESAAYNVSAAIELQGKLDLTILQSTFFQLVDRHELLRSAVFVQDGIPYWSVGEGDCSGGYAVPQGDASTESLPTLTKALTQQAFDLTQAPLWRLQLLRLDEQRHIVILVMHHLITDGWSIDLLAREWSLLYAAARSGKPVTLPELEIQYVDYAAWQRQQVDAGSSLVDYWRQQLEGVPAQLELPYDHPPLATSHAPGQRSPVFTLPPATLTGLETIGRNQQATLFMTLLASFGLLVQRVSNPINDVASLVIGTPIANRQRPELANLIGYFANMLPLRCDFTDALTFERLLQQVRETVLAAYEHQDLPFDRLVDMLEVDRTVNRNPIFQVAFLLEPEPTVIDVDGLSWQPVPIAQHSAKFDLTLMLRQTVNGLEGQWEYRSNLFNAETIADWSEIFLNLLAEVVDDSHRSIWDYSLITPAAQQQLDQWNQTQQPYDQGGMMAVFQRQVEQFPQQVALIDSAQSLTYRELDRQSNQLAHLLQQVGVQPGQPVAFTLNRSIAAVATMIAILKLGAFYLPIDAQNPVDRTVAILQESDVRWVIVETIAPEQASFPDALSCLDWVSLAAQLPHQPDQFAVGDASLENLAYVMYTSGSTGKPKGVAVTQRGILRLVQNCQFAQLDRHQRLLQAAPLAFDAATFELWGALLNGATLVILPQENAVGLSWETLIGTISQQQITTLWLTAGLCHGLIEELDRRQEFSRIASLQQLLAGGDVLASAALKVFQTHCPNLILINGYGPTENTTFTCCHRITPADLALSSPPIGKPIQNTRLYVLDDRLQLVPIGSPGQLYIAGDGLAQGYWENIELTQMQFIHCQGERLYATGDRVRWLRSGALAYLGRLDQQIKLRGFRIELGEIEAVIQTEPAIAQVTVQLNSQDFASPLLVAYCVLPDLENWDSVLQRLRSLSQKQLPTYMQPAHWVCLTVMPLTLNGKVDRTQLPLPTVLSPIATRIAQTPIEQLLWDIWQSVLAVETLQIDDNFFALGGDSILAMQVVSRAQSLGLEMTPTQLFQHQTIASLATVVTQKSAQIDVQVDAPIVGLVPLTPIQHWFFAQALPNVDYFNQSVVLEVAQPLHRETLEKAVLALFNHHDMLRSRFDRSTAGWYQEVLPPYALSTVQERLDYFQAADVNDTDFLAIANQLQASLSLTTGRLCQIAHCQYGNSFDRLLIVIHHLVVDAFSWRVLLADLNQIYQQIIAGQPIVLPPRQFFRNHAQHQLEQVHSPDVQASLNHWLAITATNQQFYHALPFDQPQGSNLVADGATQTFQLSALDTDRLLRQVNSTYSTQIQEILVAAIVQALADWSGQSTICFDLETHGRQGVESDQWQSIGWFTNLFPVSITRSHNEPKSMILQVKETLRSVPHDGRSYGLLRYLADPEVAQQLAASPSAPVCFNYLGQVETDTPIGFSLMRLPMMRNCDPQAPRPYTIEITAAVRSGQLEVELTYSRQQFVLATMQNLAEQCEIALEQLIQHCCQADRAYSPADFGLVSLGQSDIDAILAAVEFETGGVR